MNTSLAITAFLAYSLQSTRIASRADLELLESKAGDATYVYSMRSPAALLWTLESTARIDDAVILQEGVFAYYLSASEQLSTSWIRSSGNGALCIAIISTTGTPRLLECTQRRSNNVSHSGYYPTPKGLLALEGASKIIVRVTPPFEAKELGEEWWLYSISKARRENTLYPNKVFRSRLGERLFLTKAIAIEPGLIMIEWIDRPHYDDPSCMRYVGAMSLQGEAVWSLGLTQGGLAQLAIARINENDVQVTVNATGGARRGYDVMLKRNGDETWSAVTGILGR